MIKQPIINALFYQAKLPEKGEPVKGEVADQILFGDTVIPIALQYAQNPAAKSGENFTLIQQNKQGGTEVVQTDTPNTPQLIKENSGRIVLNALGAPTIPDIAGQGNNLIGLVNSIPEVPGAEVVKPATIKPELVKPVLPGFDLSGKNILAANEPIPSSPVDSKNNGVPQALLQTIAQKQMNLPGTTPANVAPVAGGTVENIIIEQVAAQLKPNPVTGLIPPGNPIGKIPENLGTIALLNTPPTLDKKIDLKERIAENPRQVRQNLRNKFLKIIESKAEPIQSAIPRQGNISLKAMQPNTNSQPVTPPADNHQQSLSENKNTSAANIANYIEPKKITTDFISRTVTVPGNTEFKAELKVQLQHSAHTNHVDAKSLNNKRYAHIEKISQTILQLSNSTAKVTNFSIEGGQLGKMTIQFTQRSLGDHVTIVVDNNVSKDFVDRLLPSIQDNLAQKGFGLSSMDVQINQRNDKEAFMQRSKSGSQMSHRDSTMNTEEILQSLIPEKPVRDYGYNTLEVIA